MDNPGQPVLHIALDVPLHRTFDYLPPAATDIGQIPDGSRVRVSVGRREAIGWVVGRAPGSALEPAALKAVHELLDRQPLLDAGLLHLLRWTARYYHHPLGEVITAAVPKAIRGGASPGTRTAFWRASDAGRAALNAGELRRAPRQRELLAALAAASCGLTPERLAAQWADWRAHARPLKARAWIEELLVETPPPGEPGPAPEAPATALVQAPALSGPQSEAVAAIRGAAGYAAFLLHGATGSGKTEVYLRSIEHALGRGGSALVLVPEIALTPQVVQRFRERLPVPIALMHSGLTDAERLAAWRSAHAGRARVVLGTRSAVFAPVPSLGLIVVDEEHDGSYKQHDGGCRYSARDLAVVRAQQSGVPIVLGSATPSFETLLNVRRGRYRVLPLPRRSDQAEAPSIALVDLRAHAVHRGLATPVIEAMRRHLHDGGQVLVFINRRGYAPTLLCTACGWIAPCRNCDARLTVHLQNRQLCCHHCGALEPLPDQCRRCGFPVKPVGQGTERVEQVLGELFPEQPLLRLDRDTAANAADLESIVHAVRSGAARILVGTQMVAKGHHFPDVSLVVVLNADQGLFSTDFRAAERLAQTIVQVAGRAGRERTRGQVLLQTEYPEHPLLQHLLQGGYDAFAAAAMTEREAAAWPPFGRLAVLRASSLDEGGAMAFLAAARAAAPAASDVHLLGPVAATIARRAGRHYAQLLLESGGRAALHRLIDAWLPEVEALARARRVRYALDVDPLDIG